MNLKILGALLRKEVTLMRRNPFIPKIIFIMPIVVMLVIPLVATMDVKNVNIAVVDNDHSELSSRIIADMDASETLRVSYVCATHDEAMAKVEADDADVLVTIPQHFSRDLSTAKIDVEANGVNATKGMLGAQYVIGSVGNTLRQWRSESGLPDMNSQVYIINRFNPTLTFRNYMIPALMVVLLIIIGGFLPALNLVSEKETGTIEAMNVTPVKKTTFVLSKLIPYWIAGLIVVTVGMLIGRFVYGLAPIGNVGHIYLAAILFSLVMSGLGVTIANKSETRLQSIFVMFAVIIIFQLMGGLFTPISSMPDWARAFTYVIPPRYFNEIIRAIYLKGATFADLGLQFTFLAGFAILTCLLAALTYSKRS